MNGKRDRAVMRRSVVAVTLVLGLSACTPGSDVAGEVPVTTGKIPSQDVVAAPEGGIEKAVDGLPGIVGRVVDRTGIPGAAVAVVHGGETVFARGFGVRQLGETARVDAETVFQIASLSKPIGATVVASQVSAGTVAWETPVSTLLPGFALSDPYVTKTATIGDFYSHRSGLPRAAGDTLEDIGYDRGEVLSRLMRLPLDPFRITYNYANFGMTVGAEAVAQAAGVPWEDLSERELYEPLGMSATSSRYADFLDRENRATLHAKSGDTFAPLFERNPDAQSPAGGVSSNVDDLARWIELVLGQGTVDGRELMSADAILPATSAQTISGHSSFVDQRASSYGYGFNVGTQPGGRVSMSHSGAFVLGAGTTVTLIPSLDLGIVVLTNAGPIGAAEAIAAEFMDVAQFGESNRDWVADYAAATASYYAPVGDLADQAAPDNPAPSGPLDGFVGTYANDYHGAAIVERDGDTLAVRVGPGGAYRFALKHWDADTFSFVPTGENAPAGSLSSAAFGTAEDGRTTLRLEFFDANGLGTWIR